MKGAFYHIMNISLFYCMLKKCSRWEKNYQSGLSGQGSLSAGRAWIRALQGEEANKVPFLGEKNPVLIWETVLESRFIIESLIMMPHFCRRWTRFLGDGQGLYEMDKVLYLGEGDEGSLSGGEG